MEFVNFYFYINAVLINFIQTIFSFHSILKLNMQIYFFPVNPYLYSNRIILESLIEPIFNLITSYIESH